MEIHLRNRIIRTLPEDRQGTSGAIAGSDSEERADGDRRLSRRAAVGNTRNDTAETRTQYADDVSLETIRPATTLANIPRVRMKWTADINKFIMRTYYTITHLETNTTSYRHTLHQIFTHKYPNITVTIQNLADRRRAIVKKHLLPEFVLQQIRAEVAEEINSDQRNNTSEVSIQPSPHTNSHTTDPTQPTPLDDDPIIVHNIVTQSDTITQQLTHMFQTTLTEYTGLNPTSKPHIPKLHTSKKLAQVVDALNRNVLPACLDDDTTFVELHNLVYCAAITVVKFLGGRINNPTHYNDTNTMPNWERRLQNKIDGIRRDLARLQQYKSGIRSSRLVRHVTKITHKTLIHSTHEPSNNTITQHIDTLTQRLSALSNRIARYRRSRDRKKQNKTFKQFEGTFYRQLSKHNTQSPDAQPPSTADLRNFWSDIWERDVSHNEGASWITDEETRTNNIPQMIFPSITQTTLTDIISRTHNWKAPGTDKIQNYWYKKFTCLHTQLTQHINAFITNPQQMPVFLTEGITYMLPKDNNISDPAKYRPITCLQTIYKIVTACITQCIQTHITVNNILAEQQKGCRPESQGSKEQLVIDSVVLKQAHTKQRNLYTTFIDYKKAFDSVPHSWLVRVLHLYRIDPDIIFFLKHAMSHWRTTLHLHYNNYTIQTDQIQIKRGIFQGDSLSPLWFCLSLNPLSFILNNSNFGFKIKHNTQNLHTISHLMYMDDIKLYASTKTQIHTLTQITHTFSNDIKMQFGLDKCRTQSIHLGKREFGGIELDDGSRIESLQEGDTYKYLGFLQSRYINHTDTKTQITQKYKNRLTHILKTYLNSKHTFRAINTYAVPILTYTFGIIHWTETDLQAVERLTRTTLTKHRKHHPHSAIERLTLPRKLGGRGLTDITNLHHKITHKLREYFYSKQNISLLHSAIVKSDTKYTPLHLNTSDNFNETTNVSDQDKLLAWSQKSLHGRHHHDLNQTHVDIESSNKWLSIGDVFPETEGFMLAIQDQIINTRNYQKHIIHDTNIETDLCRRCGSASETIQHITSACQSLAQTEYLNRHNQVSGIIHQKLARKYSLIDTSRPPLPYYTYRPEIVLENSTHKLYYDRSIITDRTIPHNRPDITLTDKINKTTHIIDITIPNTHNLQHSYTEKIIKYTALADEVRQMWRMDSVITVPIVLSCTGVIPHSLHNSIHTLQLPKHTYITLQKAVILKTCSLVRRFLNTQPITHTDNHNTHTNITTHTPSSA